MTPKKKPAKPSKSFALEYVLLGILVIVTFFTYRSSTDNPFMTAWDDQMHVTENPLVTANDGWHLRDQLTPNRKHLYHPVTMLSYTLEYKLAGPEPSVFHYTSLFLHLCNILLAYWFVQLLTKRKEIALVVAFFFALHPMQVEAIAWISGRKDVLYGFFYLLSLIAYLKFSDGARWRYYILSLLLFACSLLSKPAAVTLPVILLLTDLYRMRKFTGAGLLEKVPFVLLAIGAGLIPLLYQQSGGDVTDTTTSFTLPERLFLACYALDFYVLKFLVPVHLSALYYLPLNDGGALPLLYYVSPVLTASLVAGVWATYRKHREVWFGLLFFLVTILPVVQLIPIARVIAADRYLYIPVIGLAFVTGYVYSRYAGKKIIRTLFLVLFAGYGLFFILGIHSRIPVWKDGMSLFSDVVAKQPGHPHGWAALANVKMNHHDYAGAIGDFKQSFSLGITNAEAFNNCGACLYSLNRFPEAIPWFDTALQLEPTYSMAYYNRGRALEKSGAPEEQVLADYSRAIQCDSSAVMAYNSRGYVRFKKGDVEGALEDSERVLSLDSSYQEAWNLAGVVRQTQKRYDEAMAAFTRAISLNPNYTQAWYNRGVCRYYQGDGPGACADWQMAKEKGFSGAEELLRQFCR